jgi:hypothetical protein
MSYAEGGCLYEIASRLRLSISYLIRSNFIKTTYDISLDSWISFLPLGFSPAKGRLGRNSFNKTAPQRENPIKEKEMKESSQP